MYAKANFEEVVKEYIGPVYGFVLRLAGEREAEDVTQETFVKVWKNWEKFDAERKLKTWIFTIARNTAVDFLRKRKDVLFSDIDAKGENEIRFEESLRDEELLPSEVFERKELGEELEKALGNIAVETREIILLHNNEGLTFEEIAKVVGKPMNTVKSQYRRGLHQMRELLRI